MMVKLLLLLAAISLCVFQVSSTCTPSTGDSSVYSQYSTVYTGQATYYGAYTNGGACTLDPTPPAGTASSIWSTVAIADNIWAGSKACGMCVNITFKGSGSGATHPTGSHIVYVNNECPSCTSSGIDLGQNGDGVWDMTWEAVPCPVGSSLIQFVFQGANNYYIKLQARNTRYPVYGLSILQNGAYNALARTADNFFTAGSSVTYPLVFPLTVKVTAVTGDYVVDSIPSLTNGVVIQGTTQFLDCSGSSSSSGSATSTTGAKTTTTTTTGAKTTTTTTGAKTSTTTTGASSTTGSSTTTQTNVFTDSMNTAAFSDWSWGTVNEKVTSPVHSGTYSFGFTPASWSAAYFECVTAGCIDPSKIASVQLYIYSPFAITTQIAFALVQNSAGVGSKALNSYITAGVPVNTWTKVTISLSAFTAGSYEGFWFQDNTGGTQSQIFLDDIVVVSK